MKLKLFILSFLLVFLVSCGGSVNEEIIIDDDEEVQELEDDLEELFNLLDEDE